MRSRMLILVLSSICLVLVLGFPSRTFSIDDDKKQKDQQPKVEVPILEDVQPIDLGSEKIWMSLTISRLLAFQGDCVSVPVKLACGENGPKEVEISMQVELRTDQSATPIDLRPDVILRWVNGYAGVHPATGDPSDVLRPCFARLNPSLPITKYLRFRVKDEADPGTYFVKVMVTHKPTGQTLSQHFKLAVHLGFIFADPRVNRTGTVITTAFRDVQGNPVVPDVAILRGTKASGGAGVDFVFRETSKEAKSKIFTVDVGAVSTDNYQWTILLFKHGFREFQKRVALP